MCNEKRHQYGIWSSRLHSRRKPDCLVVYILVVLEVHGVGFVVVAVVVVVVVVVVVTQRTREVRAGGVPGPPTEIRDCLGGVR